MWLIIAASFASLAFLFWILDQIKMNESGRYVLITGCDTGFGNALAKSLDSKGCHVFATCLTTKGAQSLRSCSSERLKTVMMDVTNSESIMASFREVQESIPQGAGTLIL